MCIGRWILICSCIFLSFSTSAHAYIDPGAGNVLLQILFGGIGGIWVVFKLFGKKLLDRIRNRKDKNR